MEPGVFSEHLSDKVKFSYLHQVLGKSEGSCLPSPVSYSFLSDGRIRIPDFSPELFVAFLQDDPAHAQAGSDESGVHGEHQDEGSSGPTWNETRSVMSLACLSFKLASSSNGPPFKKLQLVRQGLMVQYIVGSDPAGRWVFFSS